LTIRSRNLPFHITLACDQVKSKCTLFHEFKSIPNIFGNGKELLNHIRISGDLSQVHEYLIHLLRFKNSETTSTFWQLQSTIVTQLQSLCNLQLVVAIILPDHDGHCIKFFISSLKQSGWVVCTSEPSFPDTSDSIAGGCWILTSVHTTVETLNLTILLHTPPPPPNPLVLELSPTDTYVHTRSLKFPPTRQSVPTSGKRLPTYLELPVLIPALRRFIRPTIARVRILS
jgi:hypothetical protein